MKGRDMTETSLDVAAFHDGQAGVCDQALVLLESPKPQDVNRRPSTKQSELERYPCFHTVARHNHIRPYLCSRLRINPSKLQLRLVENYIWLHFGDSGVSAPVCEFGETRRGGDSWVLVLRGSKRPVSKLMLVVWAILLVK